MEDDIVPVNFSQSFEDRRRFAREGKVEKLFPFAKPELHSTSDLSRSEELAEAFANAPYETWGGGFGDEDFKVRSCHHSACEKQKGWVWAEIVGTAESHASFPRLRLQIAPGPCGEESHEPQRGYVRAHR